MGLITENQFRMSFMLFETSVSKYLIIINEIISNKLKKINLGYYFIKPVKKWLNMGLLNPQLAL